MSAAVEFAGVRCTLPMTSAAPGGSVVGAVVDDVLVDEVVDAVDVEEVVPPALPGCVVAVVDVVDVVDEDDVGTGLGNVVAVVGGGAGGVVDVGEPVVVVVESPGNGPASPRAAGASPTRTVPSAPMTRSATGAGALVRRVDLPGIGRGD